MQRRRFWTPEELQTVRELYPDTRTADLAAKLDRSLTTVYQVAFKLGLHKSEAFLASPASGRTTGKQGTGTRFEKGHVPANIGLRRPGFAPGRMAETQFKKGCMRGAAQRKWKPVGTERMSKDGYLERKVHDSDNEHLPSGEANRLRARRWRAVHILVWEEVNGPLPEGFAVTFINRDRKDTRLENLELISRADLARRNSIHNLPAELKGAIRTLGALKRRIRRREKQN